MLGREYTCVDEIEGCTACRDEFYKVKLAKQRGKRKDKKEELARINKRRARGMEIGEQSAGINKDKDYTISRQNLHTQRRMSEGEYKKGGHRKDGCQKKIV